VVLLLPRFSFTKSEVSTNSYFVVLLPAFLGTIYQRMVNTQASVDATGLPERRMNIALFVLIALAAFNLHVTLYQILRFFLTYYIYVK